MKVRTAILSKPGEIHLEQRLAKLPAPDEVEITVQYAGICGTDLAIFQGKHISNYPIVLGHEFSGWISALGKSVSGFQINQEVCVAPLIACGECNYCLSGEEYLCFKRQIFGVQIDGAFRERLCLPSKTVFALPAKVTLREGALVEPLAVATHAVKRIRDIRDRKVAILGAGAIGIIIAQVARAFGATTILLIDVDQKRLNLSSQLGFLTINSACESPVKKISEYTANQGVDVLFEASGNENVLQLLPKVITPRGEIVIVGRFKSPGLLDLDGLLLKEAILLTSRYFSFTDFGNALKLLASGALSLAPLIQAEISFDQLLEQSGAKSMTLAQNVVRTLVTIHPYCDVD